MVMCINFIGEIINIIVKVGVIVFPGSNCDRDMFHVLSDVFDLNTRYYWHKKSLPDNIDAVEFKTDSGDFDAVIQMYGIA